MEFGKMSYVIFELITTLIFPHLLPKVIILLLIDLTNTLCALGQEEPPSLQQ